MRLGTLVGEPVELTLLKRSRRGTRRTLKASGPRGTVIVKLYATKRAAGVAERTRALAAGPAEPVIPRVLHVDAPRGVLVLSYVPGAPLRDALLAGDEAAAWRVGAVLGAWHRRWWRDAPEVLHEHGIARELATLDRTARRAGAGAGVMAEASALARDMAGAYDTPTVVHRDLYEDQIMVGDRVGLIDLDEAAAGPPELDVGNLLAHVDLLAVRTGAPLEGCCEALLDGYGAGGPPLDDALLAACRRLTTLRLACLHAMPELAAAGAQTAAR